MKSSPASLLSRLLTADRDALTGKATIQVTHEALLGGWDRLRAWIDDHSTDLQRRSALSAGAAEWEASVRDPDYLLTGSRLAQLEAWSQETTMALTPLESAFLRASLDQRALPPIAFVSEGSPATVPFATILEPGLTWQLQSWGEGVVAEYPLRLVASPHRSQTARRGRSPRLPARGRIRGKHPRRVGF